MAATRLFSAVPTIKVDAMPVYSMTGYAHAQQNTQLPGGDAEVKTTPGARLGMEIRSVNSRFLDLSLRLPDELRQHEPALRELLTARLKRGKVEIRAVIESTSSQTINDPSPRLLQRMHLSELPSAPCGLSPLA